jgi:hypothetical protein
MTTVLTSRSRTGWMVLWPLLGAAGCAFNPSGAAGDDDGIMVDGSPGGADSGGGQDGGRPDGGGGRDGGGGCEQLLPFIPSNFSPCDLGPLEGAIVLDQTGGPYVLDTESGRLTRPDATSVILDGEVIDQLGAPDIFAVATTSFIVAAQVELDVNGSRALAVVSTGDIAVDGVIDVGAAGDDSGPGGDDDGACAGGRGDIGQLRDQGGAQFAGTGGGGGGFAAAGGEGAGVEDADDPAPVGGGSPGGSADLTPLRGGCAGGAGAVGGVNGGAGGGGGGALQLVAGDALTVDGVITARGAGGAGIDSAVNGGGGGGGGSGGGLLLEATTLEVNGAVTANGGGGGEGTRTDNSTENGGDGFDDQSGRAPGGTGGNGGDGGGGGALAAENGEPGLIGDSVPGALAGGSAGRIALRAVSGRPIIGGSAVVSPAAP